MHKHTLPFYSLLCYIVGMGIDGAKGKRSPTDQLVGSELVGLVTSIIRDEGYPVCVFTEFGVDIFGIGKHIFSPSIVNAWLTRNCRTLWSG